MMVSAPAEIQHKPHVDGNTGVSRHYLDYLIVPKLKPRLLDYTSLSMPRTILTTGGDLLDVTSEDVFHGLITDECGKRLLAQIPKQNCAQYRVCSILVNAAVTLP